MKCPKCGSEIREDHLYCEKCGMEIRIVPDFEPEIENSITKTLSGVGAEIKGGEKQKEESREEEKETEKKEEVETFFQEENGRNWIFASMVTLIIIALIATGASAFMYMNYSASHQVKTARRYAEEGNYDKAIKHLDKAVKLDEKNAEIVLLQSSYYYASGNAEQAAEVILNLIEREQLTHEDMEKAYASVIAIYDEEGRYEEINELLLQCQDKEVVTVFQNYMAMAPEFSFVTGSYDEVVPLKLSANTTGKIYYTMDGSTPTQSSKVYTAPVFLESGKYQIAALFVNDYGIQSNVVKNWYEINLTIPDAPKVFLYSGRYEVPTLIEVEMPLSGTVYYTTDGSVPNVNSQKYTEPVPMPLGRSNYKFVVISEEGVASEVISRSYEFKLDTDVSTDKAVQNVKWALMEREVLTDIQGHAQGSKGRYVFQYDTIVQIEENYYYEIVEYYEDTGGSRSRTGHLYAVEVYSGRTNRLIYDEQGQMGLIPLTDVGN